MQRYAFSKFGFSSLKGILNTSKSLFKQRSKLSWKLTTGLLVASSYGLMSHFMNTKAQTTSNDSTENGFPPDFKAPDLEKFSDAGFQEAVKNRENVVIVWNVGENVQASIDEIKVLLHYLKESKTIQRTRDYKFFMFQPENEQEIQEFQEKYKIKVPEGAIFLIKNAYSNTLKAISTQTALYNFEVIFNYFQRLRKLGPHNFEKFSGSIKHLPSNSVVIIGYVPSSSKNYESLKNQFAEMKTDQAFGRTRFKNIEFMAVTDEETAKKLNLESPKEGKLYMVTKSSKYNHHVRNLDLNETNLNVLPLVKEINAKKDEVLAELSLIYKNYFVFELPNFNQFPSRYSIILKVDKNQIGKREYNLCVSAFSELHKKLRTDEKELFKDIKIVKSNDKLEEGKPYRVFVIDNQARENYFSVFLEEHEDASNAAKDISRAPDVAAHTFVYKFPEGQVITGNQLFKFINDVKSGQAKEFFETQKEPLCQRYSTKIVNENFEHEIIKNNKNHVLFFHSAHCHACKNYTPYYEKFALENLRNPASDLQYNRMDSDFNHIKDFVSFHHTPVFMVLRKEDKLKPFVYMSQFFNEKLLKDFISITLDQKFVPEDVEKKMFEGKNEKLKALQPFV